MKRFLGILLISVLAFAMSVTAASDESVTEEKNDWAYGAMPLNSEDYGVATIYYTAEYYALDGIVNPTNPEYAPYTEEEILAIVDGAVDGAEGYIFNAPANALIGMTVYGNEDVIYWYNAENAAAITGHADPLCMDTETGVFKDMEGKEVAVPIK